MIYKNIDIPSNFNKIAEISDNFIVWVKEATLNSGVKYQAYIQFFIPSMNYLYVEDYVIKTGSNYSLNANYINNGVYSYVSYYDLDYSLNTLTVDDDFISQDDYNRADYTVIFLCGFVIVTIFTIILYRLIPKTRR